MGRANVKAAVMEGLNTHAEVHWWNRGRRRIVRRLLRRYCPPKPNLLLDVGCGVGTHLRTLARFGEVVGADPSPQALAFCRKHFAGRLEHIVLPDQVPFAPQSFDVITMLDVLEHVEDDRAALVKIRDLLRPGGVLLLTVPALGWLWTAYDDHSHHFRRYHRGPLRDLLLQTGFEVKVLSYFNFFLFPLMLVSRLCFPASYWNERDMIKRGNYWLTRRLFENVFAFEGHLLSRVRLPIGGSLIAVARRKENDGTCQEP
jgi:SAM-dependent methyltransferase